MYLSFVSSSIEEEGSRSHTDVPEVKISQRESEKLFKKLLKSQSTMGDVKITDQVTKFSTQMNREQIKEYNRLKKRESRQKMTVEKRAEERCKDKLRKENFKLNMSDAEYEYASLAEKHRKRKERQGRDEERKMRDNLKAKASMRQFRENLPDKYIPRVKKNISEADDWEKFSDTNLESKELLAKRLPKMAKHLDERAKEEQKILSQKVMLKDANITRDKQMDAQPFDRNVNEGEECTCSHDFAYCLFCQNQGSAGVDCDDSVYKLDDHTQEQLEEFERHQLEEWQQWNKEQAKNRKREKAKSLKSQLLQPISMPETKKSEYEKIRDSIIAQRKEEWAKLEKQWDADTAHS